MGSAATTRFEIPPVTPPRLAAIGNLKYHCGVVAVPPKRLAIRSLGYSKPQHIGTLDTLNT
jgi:hypothetical protein